MSVCSENMQREKTENSVKYGETQKENNNEIRIWWKFESTILMHQKEILRNLHYFHNLYYFNFTVALYFDSYDGF